MAIDVKSIYYITNPDHMINVRESNIKELKKLYDDFNFKDNACYIFTFKNLNIIISNGGHIQISLMTTLELSEAIQLLEKMAKKINSVLGIEIYSKKVMI